MDASLVELAGLLVVAHDRLYLPALRIGLVDFRGLHVKVAFQDHRPEPRLLFLESCVVIVLRAVPDEVRLFLCRPSLVAEGIEELPASFDGRLPVENVVVSLQDSLVFVHGVPFRQLRVPFHRIEIVKLRILLEALRRGRRREALVRDDNAFLYATFLDEIGICGHVEHVPGIALGTDRLLLLEIERIDDGNVPGALRPCLSREVGQGDTADYLELSEEEEALIDWVGDNFGTTIVCLNVANTMELKVLDNENIDAVLWVGHPGSFGFSEVGKVLRGTVNPSGRTVDTWAYDTKSSPAYYNANMRYTYSYTNSGNSYYVDYSEGIYVGYRYYETKYIDDEEGYQAAVQYPFGYGLSYSDFAWKVTGTNLGEDTISVDVEVTNKGPYAGKDVVELYVTSPYTNGGIEKAHKNLVAFEKTPVIQPNDSETVTLSFDVRDLASYDFDDANNDDHTGYELEAGDYILSFSTDAHNVKAGVDTITYTVKSQRNFDTSRNGTTIENRFEDAMTDGSTTYITRADNFKSNFPSASRQPREASQKVLDAIAHQTDIVDDPSDTFPTTDTITHYVDAEERDENGDIVYDEEGNVVYQTTVDDNGNETIAQRGLYLSDMAGLDYDDPLWEDLLNQLTVDEMATMIAEGGYQTQAVKSINKGLNRDLDGPQGFNFSNVSIEKLKAMSYPSEVVVGSTWNKELGYEEGRAFGLESASMGVTGVYAPAVNIHRQPYGGRNFEYYSEDPLLSGKMAANFVSGAQSEGLNCYVKHFAVNDQETQRYGLFTYLDEQALREIYLKPFQIAVEEGKTRCIMSSFNRIGTTWSGASYALLTEVLREEGGFEGCVVTDYYMNFQVFMDPNQGIRAGNDLWLTGFTMLGKKPDLTSATSQQAARRACHSILYAVANANPSDIELNEDWLKWFIPVDVALWVVVLVWTGLVIYKTIKFQKEEDVPAQPANA